MSASGPVIIVGGGIAGLTTALRAAPTPVLLLTRAPDALGAASALAQGGIAASLGNGDTPAAHARDTCAAGGFHNDAAIVDLLTSHAADAVHWLQDLGVVFDRESGGGLQFGREGGHDRARIVHAGGDATGATIMETLIAAACDAPHIERRAGVHVDGLVLRGVRAIGDDGSCEVLSGRAVVLATGGIGGLFAQTSNPATADGSGLALALAAGARARDLEFVQFHPTALAVPGLHSLPLVTEALRGAGAILRDDKGRSLMDGVHPLGDLAPRDIVARRVWRACQEGGAQLDARGIGTTFPQRFPTVFRACMQHGIDPRTQPIPVAPAAHFHMGGIAVDADGRSSLPGLHAVGEVACNGAHGANRLASNSLLEGVVFGRRLGRLLRGLAHDGHSLDPLQVVQRKPSLDPTQLDDLRTLMTRAMGPMRNGADLRAALDACTELAETGWQGELAQRMLTAALTGTESLGAHYRNDAIPENQAGIRIPGSPCQ